jgi:uncharacterized protein
MMHKEVGNIIAIYRYPVKSMAGHSLTSAELGWHGLAGDRRFALLRKEATGGFPWLTASKLPQLVTYTPVHKDSEENSDLPTHIRTPAGVELALRSEELWQELSQAHGSPVEIMQLNQGIFDEAPISIISVATIKAVEQMVGFNLDIRRFRPNLLIETVEGQPFEEQQWLNKTIRISKAAMHIYLHDIRCAIVNIDPDSGELDPRIMKAIVKGNDNCAGVYASVIGKGTISVDDKIYLDE